MSGIAPSPEHVRLLRQAIEHQCSDLAMLYDELHALAYDSTASDVKVRLHGSDPTFDMATDDGGGAIRSELDTAANHMKAASKELRMGLGKLRDAMRATSVNRSKLSTWTSADVQRAEELARRRQKHYGRGS